MELLGILIIGYIVVKFCKMMSEIWDEEFAWHKARKLGDPFDPPDDFDHKEGYEAWLKK
jgi:hypothetical protein